MVVILNQTLPSLFLFTPNLPLSLRGRTEPGMKSLFSPANPARWVHVHRQPSERAAATGPVCGESLMKPNEISLLKVSHGFSFSPFFFPSTTAPAALPLHPIVPWQKDTAKYPHRWECQETAEKSFFHTFLEYSICATCLRRKWRLNLWVWEKDRKIAVPENTTSQITLQI